MLGSGRFPFSAVGRLNLYRLFLEHSHSIVNNTGRVGLVIPSGFASGTFAQKHFNELHSQGRIVSLFDFENRESIFSGVHRSYKFCLITLTGKDGAIHTTDFVFFAQQVGELSDTSRHIPMSQSDLCSLNPITLTAPLFRSRQDQEITLRLHRDAPILTQEDSERGWRVKPTLMFMMNASMKIHRSADELESAGYALVGNWYATGDEKWLPLYEGKMVGMYDHRAASIRFDPSQRVRQNQPVALGKGEHIDPSHLAQPMFWVAYKGVYDRCGSVPRWCLVVKDITAATNVRTAIAAMLPRAALTHSLSWLSNSLPAGLKIACRCGLCSAQVIIWL
jgi:hypothetical protein